MAPIIYENVSQVAKRLKVSPSTVKKYYLLIEGYNCYAFKRDERERVIFDDYDVRLLQRLVELKSMPQVTLEDACKLLLEEEGLTVKNTDMTVKTPGSDDLKVLLKELKDTVELQQKLLDYSSAIEKQQVIDRDQAVMTVMRELQEVKQIVAASNEKKWYQFWK
ncbi:hypothetical protein COF51_15050 [Bacillus pseudomycoides]|uniref:DUF3967 domain-containing protein n=1 Tax=Bacillus pseudomycoides TaxID=64104 RepID=UPI000BF32C8C|nr:DUF3967 domain-containing protein [Bacillus pseudomycoides]PGE94007.1 hypothetical protein COM62_26190 [Bacillus pseudomycoides]PHE37859.1 hypothetical protein COF51_15050 [Bacillus pseudomycoides]